MKYLLFFLLTPLFSIAGKTDTLHLGQTLPLRNIQPQQSQYLLYWEMPDGKTKFVALETRTVSTITLAGKAVYIFIQQYSNEKGTDYDTSFFDAKTLMPLQYRSDIASAGYKESIDFNGTSVRTTIRYADSVIRQDKEVPLSLLAPMEDLIFSLLPLKEGYQATYRSLNPGKNHFEFFTSLQVTGSDTLVLPDHTLLPCWKVTSGKGPSMSVIWYSKKDQQFIRREFRNAKGVFKKVMLYNTIQLP